MAGKDVSYQFLDALAKSVGMDALTKSVGMDAETVKQALAEINQLQQQTQALEVAVQGKAPTNHASQQPIFGTADEQMYGHVKIAHEVTNNSTDGVAVSPDAVYAYAPAKGMAVEMPASGDYLTSTAFTKSGQGKVSIMKNGQLCVTGTMIFQTTVQPGTNINTLPFNNTSGVSIPCLAWWVWGDIKITAPPNRYCTHITPNGFINHSGTVQEVSTLTIALTAGIYPIFATLQ